MKPITINPLPNRDRDAGFTLAELLVSVSISIVLLASVMYVFTSSASAIRGGTAAAEFINTSRSINEQISRDMMFNQMLGPDQNGILVIVNTTLSNVRLTPLDQRRDVRADQIMFIRDNTGSQYQPTAPGYPASFDGRADHASRVRIWYGHAQTADPLSTSYAFTLTNNFNNASSWVLGRHVLFLLDTPDGGASAYNSSIRANGARRSSTVSGISGAPGNLWHGYADVAAQPYEGLVNLNVGGASGAPTPVQGLIDDAQPDAADEILSTLDSYQKYRESLAPYLPGGDPITNAERLVVNPRFEKTLEALPADNQYLTAWRVGQAHAVWAEQVSEFIVQFATDADNDGRIDVDPNGNIIWYDRDNPPTDPHFTTTSTNRAPWNNSSVKNRLITGTSNRPTDVFVFRHDDTGPDSRWPRLIRIQYRLHHPSLRVEGADGQPGKLYEIILPVNVEN